MITKPVNGRAEIGREQIALDLLVLGLRTIATTAETASDPRLFRTIALQTLKEASRFVDLPRES
jgi:hypothetical protein